MSKFYESRVFKLQIWYLYIHKYSTYLFLCLGGNTLREQCKECKRLYYIRSTINPSYDTSDLPARGFSIALQPAVGPMYCRSDTDFIEKKFVYPTQLFCRSDAQLQQVRSDAQLQLVGSTILIGRMHNFDRSDAQLWQVGCTAFLSWLHSILQVGFTINVLT